MAAVLALVYTIILDGKTDAVVAEGFFSDADISEIVADRFPEPDADWFTIEFDEDTLEVMTSPLGENAALADAVKRGAFVELL